MGKTARYTYFFFGIALALLFLPVHEKITLTELASLVTLVFVAFANSRIAKIEEMISDGDK